MRILSRIVLLPDKASDVRMSSMIESPVGFGCGTTGPIATRLGVDRDRQSVIDVFDTGTTP